MVVSLMAYKKKRSKSAAQKAAANATQLAPKYATPEMLYAFRAELKSDNASLRLEMQSGFKKVDARFNEMESRFSSIDARFEQMESRFASIDARFNQMESRFAAIDARFEQMESRFAAIDARFDKLEARMLKLESLVEAQNAKLDRMLALFEEQRAENRFVIDMLQDLHRRVSKLENPDAEI